MHLRANISQKILRFYSESAADTNHRYRSWEHCFGFFSRHQAFSSQENADIAALHLAFYLASWGMYRGSSALLWKDYRVHVPAVLKILDRAYAHLWHPSFDNAPADAAIARDILSLSKELRNVYCQTITTVNGQARHFQATDTLITKILLGTLGCTPAVDQYFIAGFRKELSYSGFKEQFLCRAFAFIRENERELCQVQTTIHNDSGIRYPVMKLVDMYFWELGAKP